MISSAAFEFEVPMDELAAKPELQIRTSLSRNA
jgi:hypothetical protein